VLAPGTLIAFTAKRPRDSGTILNTSPEQYGPQHSAGSPPDAVPAAGSTPPVAPHVTPPTPTAGGPGTGQLHVSKSIDVSLHTDSASRSRWLCRSARARSSKRCDSSSPQRCVASLLLVVTLSRLRVALGEGVGRRKSIIAAIWAAVSLALLPGCVLTPGDEAPKVVVLGLDGATWRLIDPMLAQGRLPNLHKLVSRGIYGDLVSSPPILSPIVWTTIFTGKNPKAHGVDSRDRSTSSHRRCKALWNISSEQGLETVVVNVPGTWPPEEIKGAMVSGFPISGSQIGAGTGIVISRSQFTRQELPQQYRLASEQMAAATRQLKIGQWSDWIKVSGHGPQHWLGIFKIKRMTESRFYLSPVYRYDNGIVFTQPKELQQRLEKVLGSPYVPEGPGWSRWKDPEQPAYLYDQLVEISRLQTRASLFLLKQPWDLFVYVLTLTDRVQHPYWSFMEPESFTHVDADLVRRFKDRVAASYKEADYEIGEVVDKLGDESYVIIVSDHGFRPSPSRDKHIGEHDFTGIYIIAGPGLSSLRSASAHLTDITPTLLYLLKLPVAEDMEGSIIPAVRRQLRRHPTSIASYEGTARKFNTKPVDDKIRKQLKSLGYIDK